VIGMEMMGKFGRCTSATSCRYYQIAERTGLSRNTIRKWIRAPESKQPVYLRHPAYNKLSPLPERLEQALKPVSLRAEQPQNRQVSL
jgi:transposase-like protein